MHWVHIQSNIVQLHCQVMMTVLMMTSTMTMTAETTDVLICPQYFQVK